VVSPTHPFRSFPRDTVSPLFRRASILLVVLAWPISGHALPEGPFKPSSELAAAPWSKEMDALIARLQRRFPGTMNVYVSDPWRGFRYGHRDDVPVYLASVVKTTFMIETFRQREQGKLRFEDTLEFSEDDIRDGAPRMNSLELGTRHTISQLLDWMIRSSDNAASDMLARHVGLRNIERGLVEEGLLGFTRLTYLIDVRRGVFRNLDIAADDLTPRDVRDIRWTPIWEPQIRELEKRIGRPPLTYDRKMFFEAYDRYYETNVNAAPMRTMGLLYEKILRRELVSPKASEDMFALLGEARTSEKRLMGRLPENTRVLHKTGSQFNRCCDTGIVVLPDGRPLVMAICTQNGLVPQSEDAISQIARKAFDLAIEDHERIR
jgi:beta-lactamase class A